MVRDGTHHTGQVIEHYERQQRVEQTVTAAEEIAQPTANGGEDELNCVPEFLHFVFLLKFNPQYHHAR